MDFGSGSALLGGGDQALQEALARRQSGQGGATSMVSPAAANYQPQPQAPQGAAPTPQGGGDAGMQTGGDPIAFENQIILKTLDDTLKRNAKNREMVLNPVPQGGV